jgi:hypothetical protein
MVSSPRRPQYKPSLRRPQILCTRNLLSGLHWGQCQSSLVNPSCICIQTILHYMYILSMFHGKKLCICQRLYLLKNTPSKAGVYLILVTAIQLQYTHFYTLTLTSNDLGHSADALDTSPATTFRWRMVILLLTPKVQT